MKEFFDNSGKPPRTLPANSHLWEPEDVADKLYFLVEGRVCIGELDRDGREIMLETISAGEFFGENCFCENGSVKQTSTAKALVDSLVIEISAAEFLAAAAGNLALLQSFIASLANRMSQSERRISILSTRGVEQRLGAALLHLATTGENGETRLYLTHDELSAFASISRQRVTKTMIFFREIGLVRYDRTLPLIINQKALAEFLEL